MTTADDARQQAELPPVLIRSLLRVAQQRGVSPERLCLGLGFAPADLKLTALRVSYRQTRELAARVRLALDDATLGLHAGQVQSPLSWGMVGLAMTTCRTLGQAMAMCLAHQRQAGTFVDHEADLQGDSVVIEARPRFHDPAFEPLLIDESFSAIVTVARALAGAAFVPKQVEFAYDRPPNVMAYPAVFGCPVRFGMPAHRLWIPARWLACELPGWDPYASDALRTDLAVLMPPLQAQEELLESILVWLRTRLDERPSMDALARHLNLGERTLRRRLAETGTSWRKLLNQVRRECALSLLQHAGTPVGEVAFATGFSDARGFRRAIKRWTGKRPSSLRRHHTDWPFPPQE